MLLEKVWLEKIAEKSGRFLSNTVNQYALLIALITPQNCVFLIFFACSGKPTHFKTRFRTKFGNLIWFSCQNSKKRLQYSTRIVNKEIFSLDTWVAILSCTCVYILHWIMQPECFNILAWKSIYFDEFGSKPWFTMCKLAAVRFFFIRAILTGAQGSLWGSKYCKKNTV